MHELVARRPRRDRRRRLRALLAAVLAGAAPWTPADQPTVDQLLAPKLRLGDPRAGGAGSRGPRTDSVRAARRPPRTRDGPRAPHAYSVLFLTRSLNSSTTLSTRVAGHFADLDAGRLVGGDDHRGRHRGGDQDQRDQRQHEADEAGEGAALAPAARRRRRRRRRRALRRARRRAPGLRRRRPVLGLAGVAVEVAGRAVSPPSMTLVGVAPSASGRVTSSPCRPSCSPPASSSALA